MLFDLRGRGRRRTVQVVYGLLALLMAGGLIGFGIGSGVNGGLFDFLKGDGGSSVSEVGQQQVRAAEAKTRANPKSAQAWADLARAHVARASSIGLDQEQGRYTAEGKQELAKADAAWQRALALTKKPDENVATLMVRAYADGALADPKAAVAAYEIVIESRTKPTSEQFSQYALLAYQASQFQKGDLAAKKAVALAPRAQRKNLKQQLDQVKTQIITPQAQPAQQAQQSSGAGGSAKRFPPTVRTAGPNRMPPLGIEPRTFALRVRCSAN